LIHFKFEQLLPKIFRSLFFLINIGSVLWLILCLWAAYYDPTILSLFSFSCVFAVLLNLFFVVFWLFTKKKLWSLLSVLSLIICYPIALPVYGLNFFGNNVTKEEDAGLKVMTWNVHMFDLGGWTKDETAKARMLKLIKDENPDVLCLEEFYWDADNNIDPYTSIIQQSGYPFISFARSYTMRKNYITSNARKGEMIEVGSIIFSKFPLKNEKVYPLNNSGYNLLSAEVMIDSTRIFNINVVHLTSVSFGRKEMNYITDVKEKGVESAEERRKSKWLLRKLINASAERAILANRVDSVKREMDYPIILCGDFNDIPGSYVYTKTKGKLKDAFVAKGAGLGRTYRYIFPTLRIDYILYDEGYFTAEGYRRIDVHLSDHYPILAYFSFKEQ
jgi:endonuclease/exonuclease/phosphatase family metal-dependent hydrolase